MSESLEVWLDADFLPERLQVGSLAHDRGAVRFSYEPAWLQHPLSFALDPDLSLGEGAFYPRPEQGNFRIFDDSAPDRWGQMLMRRREALVAKDEGRGVRTLRAWDFLLGVQDLTRPGALRFRRENTTAFLADDTLSIPPVTSLRELISPQISSNSTVASPSTSLSEIGTITYATTDFSSLRRGGAWRPRSISIPTSTRPSMS
jgi:serine/threonine-protein kinase HipA